MTVLQIASIVEVGYQLLEQELVQYDNNNVNI